MANLFRRCLIICVLFLLFPLVLLGESPERWEVLYEQSENLEEIANSELWESFSIGNSLILPYASGNRIQYLWLRAPIDLVQNPNLFYGISCERLPAVDRVYINDHLIGYVNEEEIKSIDGSRNYIIPHGILHEGRNWLYMRIGWYDGWEFELSDTIEIQDAESFRKTKDLYRFYGEFLPFAVLILIMGTFFSLLFKSLSERGNREYLILAFRLAIVILCYLTFYSPIPIFSIKVIISIWKMVLPLFLLTMVLLYQEIFKTRLENLNHIFTVGSVSISLLIFIITYWGVGESLGNGLLVLSFCSAALFIFYILQKILKSRSSDFKLMLILSDAVLIFFNIIIVSLYLIGNILILDPSVFSVVSGLMLTLLFSLYFSKHEALRKIKLENLIEKLEKIEAEKKEEKRYNISPSLEKKLAEIIEHIQQNFTDPLYREDLAESVGVNPNYFSTLFNIYTGKKVNQYINDLRLDRSSQLLLESKDSIVDVAFSSGFESLTTFNRLFKKKFECSPKEFRKK